MRRVAIAAVVIACNHDAPIATNTLADAAAHATASVGVAPASSSHACPPGMQTSAEHATHIENGACSSNADCVLTDEAAECNACNVAQAYVALRSKVSQRDAVCSLGACAQCCDPVGCPPRDQSIPAFYRAECRGGRCIAWRYHSGG